MILGIGPLLEGHPVIYLAIQTHPSCRFVPCRFVLAVVPLGLRRSGSSSQFIESGRSGSDFRSRGDSAAVDGTASEWRLVAANEPSHLPLVIAANSVDPILAKDVSEDVSSQGMSAVREN